MTTQVTQQPPPQASSSTSASQSTLSYASTAKKAVSSPAIATSSSTTSPAVAVGGSAPAQQHGKSSSISPMNGRASIPPAVPVAISAPAIAHGSSAPNGASEHSRTSSVVISANGTSGYIPNGGPVGGQRSDIKFGFQESPAASHSTPQVSQSNTSAPIPIPGSNPRVTSPAQSPSPIPQPTASGGRPPSSLVPGSNGQFQIGSFEGDRNRQAGIPQGPTAPGNQTTHLRRESNHSSQGDQAPIRGGFNPQGGRGRGSFNPQNQYQPQGGYSPAPAFRQAPGRGGMAGGMAPPFAQGRPMGNPPYQSSPNLTNRSPAMPNSQPGTPNLNQAMPIQNQQQQYGNFYAPHMQGGPQASHPSSSNFQRGSGLPSSDSASTNRGGKADTWQKKNKQSKYQRSSEQSNELYDKSAFHDQVSSGRQGVDRSTVERTPIVSDHLVNGAHPQFQVDMDVLPLPPHPSEHRVLLLDRTQLPPLPPSLPSPIPPPPPSFLSPQMGDAAVRPIDLRPESGGFDRVLTDLQNYGFPPQNNFTNHMQGYAPMNPMNGGAMMYPQMGQMNHYNMAPQSPQPPYTQPYHPGQYGQQAQPMSRNSSQMSEHRPASSMGQQPQTPLATPAVHNNHTPQANSPAPSFKPSRGPRKSQAIVIKRPDGEALDIEKIKAPASPAPKERVKTPPAVVSTPPPKSATPQNPRVDSAAMKTASQIQAEIKEKVQKAAAADSQAKADEEAKAAAEAKVAEEDKAKEDAKAAEAAKAKEAEDKAAADKAAAEKKAREDEEEIERQIEEMERAEAEREKKEQEILAKRNAEKAIADKAKAEKAKVEAEENDRKLREAEREMERLEDEKEAKRLAEAAKSVVKDTKEAAPSTTSTLVAKLSNLSLASGASTPVSDDSMGPPPKVSTEKRSKPAALNLTPLNTNTVEPPQPSAALQSLKSARFLTVINSSLYPENIRSPNPALNSAVTTKGKSFKYDKEFLLQFQKVFVEKPSVEFDSQIKALIGDPSDGGSARSASTRGGSGMGPRGSNRNPPGAFAMGSFGAGGISAGGKTLPPGTTSADRFAMANGSMPRPAINPMASFTRPGGAFSGGNSMTRSPSSSNMNNVPHSPRQGSRRGGDGGSKRSGYQGGGGGGNNSKQEAQAAKTMPLTAGMDLKPIQVSASGWKPRSIVQTQSATGAAGPAPGASSGGSGLMDPEMVQRKVKAALNKMTPEKFDKIADQVLVIAAQSKDESDGRTLRQVIQLTFEKATDEAHWASMYAKFCKRMLETMNPDIKDMSIVDKNGNVVSGGNLFRKYLLNRCQEEFERGWKMDLGAKPEGEEGDEKSAEAVMLSDDYYKEAAAKRRGLGLVQFIGELYKLSMLTERIMHECVKKLVDYTGIPDEAEIESLTKLLKTIGLNLDSTEKGKPMMDVYFQRIQSMVDTPDLPSRLRFMLMDIIDLRKKNWQSKETNKGPKTLDEVRLEAEAAAAQKQAENSRGNQRGGGGGGGGGRMQQGRGDSRNFSGQYGNQPPPDYNKNTVGMDDLRRLGAKGAANRNASQPMSFGPTSMFSSRSNSGRKMGPGGNLTRGGEDSGASSRTGTPPQQKEKESSTSANAFSLLAGLSGESEHPASPPSTATSPELAKASPALGKSVEKEGE